MNAQALLAALLFLNGQNAPEEKKAQEMKDTPAVTVSEDAAATRDSGTSVTSKSIRGAELDMLFNELLFGLAPASFPRGAAGIEPAVQPINDGTTILSLCNHAKVASSYVRILDVVKFVEDPESLEPLIGAIIICPSHH